jgi:hypothetical protein
VGGSRGFWRVWRVLDGLGMGIFVDGLILFGVKCVMAVGRRSLSEGGGWWTRVPGRTRGRDGSPSGEKWTMVDF